MGYARSHTIEPGKAGAFHLMCRCVRRAFPCGEDESTGQNFDHRKTWIENRGIVLSKLFAIDVYAYAVMSNHYHVVVWNDPKRAKSWSDEEVARRWVRLFPNVTQQASNDRTWMCGLGAVQGWLLPSSNPMYVFFSIHSPHRPTNSGRARDRTSLLAQDGHALPGRGMGLRCHANAR